MTGRHLNYYGYDKTTYKECIQLIRSTNRKHIAILNTWFLLVNLFYLMFSALNLFGVTQERIPFYTVYLILAIVFEIFVFVFPKTMERFHLISLHLNIILLLSYGILTSVAKPYMPATMFLLLIALSSVTYIGLMYPMILLSTFACGLFVWTSFKYKTFSIAYHDTYNIVIVYTLSIGLHYMFQRTRIHQFVLYQHDLQIQKELEVKSSFDALTGLLNRGKFFSIVTKIFTTVPKDKMYLCLLDLDGFKEINDNLGHQMGDKAIQITGKTILSCLGLSELDRHDISNWDITQIVCFAGRLGGDEFIVLLRGPQNNDEAVAMMQKILSELNSTSFGGLEGIHASIGLTEITSEDSDIDGAYKRADEALYCSKRAGKNKISFGEASV